MQTCRLIVGMAAAAVLLFGADPVIGTWKMNVAKSKFNPGPAPKNAHSTYTQDGDWISLKTVGTSADGTAVERTNRFKTDGGMYAFNGPTGPGKLSVKKIDDHTYESTTVLDAGGKVVSRNVYSKDGKTRTQTVSGVNSTGEKLNHVIVFERQ